jgi:tetratricopeptide (TPR) repeat protein
MTDDELRSLAEEAIANSDLRLAISVLTTLVRKNPGDCRSRLLRAQLYHKLGEWGGALLEFNMLVKLFPKDPLPLFRRALLLHDADKLSRAEADVTKALEMAPDMVEARLWRAAVRLTLWDCDKAAEDCRTVLGIDPDNRDATRLLAMAEARKAELQMVKAARGGDRVAGAWWKSVQQPNADMPECRPTANKPLTLLLDPHAWPDGARLEISIVKLRPRKDKPVKQEPAAEKPSPDGNETTGT